MRFADFRDRAIGEGLRYKEDRMVFLRELAQNSRDAGAWRIGVSALLEGDDVVIAFGDDGSGMTFEHARKFLFTLYASSKEDQERAVGRFGVGFWSVLLLDPDHLVIESMTDDDGSWALALDGALREPRRVECGLGTPGTRITLRRHVAPGGEGQRVLLEVERALGKYCRHLRRNDRAASVLPVSLNGRRVDKPFVVGGPCWLAFRDGAVEGAVGLGERPRVELYARGILVWRGTSIDELRHCAPPAREPAVPDGLAPVYILCGNDLSVTMDRRAVIDDRALSRVRLAAGRRMRELLGLYLDGLGRRPAHQRLGSWIAGRLEDLRTELRPGPWIAVTVALAIIAALSFLGPRLLFGDRGTDPEPGPLIVVPGGAAATAATTALAMDRPVPLGPAPGFDGPLVHPLGREARTFLGYVPAGEPVLLRILVAEEIHPGRGPRAAKAAPPSDAPAFRCAARCLAVETVVDAGPGPLHLPTPTGHRVDLGSIWLAGEPVKELRLTTEGQAVVVLAAPVRGGLLYRTGPSMEPLEPARRSALLAVPDAVRLPADFAAAVGATMALPAAADRMALLRAFVERRIAYDRSPSTAEAYARHAAGNPAGGWLEFVSGLGRGDCDVKNGLLMLLARRAGIPARLAIGFAGRDGRARPGLHAWVEYHDQGWLPVDASGGDAADGAPGAPPISGLPTAPTTPGPALIDGPFADSPPAPRPAWLVPLIVIAASVALLAALTGLGLLLSGRVSRKLVAPGGSETRRKVAAEMLAGVLARPGSWSGAVAVASRPLMPVLGDGPPMSLAECLDRGRAGRLWYSTGQNSLARLAVGRKARILDAADQTFGDLASRIPGAADLDDVAHLAPVPADRLLPAHRHVGELIEEADRLASVAGMPAGSLLPCPGLEGALCRDVDLTGLPLAGTAFPQRFVAVAVSHREVLRHAALAAANRPLAAFLLLDIVLARSGL
ncbi:MAG TPA: transglutaminase domain-containing protein, partial [Polyangia bacterium]|nr:transglutaminase domain-containing protein [Polyangia bacterium]